MDPAALGARCLDHLNEIENQRSRCSNISGRVAGRMKDSKRIAAEITKAMIERLTLAGDAFSLKNENFALKEELEEIKRKEQAQSKEINSLRKMITDLQREIRSLKEGFGPFPAMVSGTSSPYRGIKSVKALPLGEKRPERKEKRTSASPVRLEVAESNMEVEPLVSDIPGCSKDRDYMDHDTEWPGGAASIPWTKEDKHRKVEISNAKIKNRSNLNSNMYSDPNMYDDNVNFSTKPNFKNYAKKVDKINPAAQSTPRSKGIRSGTNTRSRLANNKKETAKPGRRFTKSAVVTITSKPDGLTYAQILAKAREKVCLRELGIQTTIIRRAISDAIVIKVPGPQGKQLASVLRSNLAEVLGQDAKVQNPVTMGELRLRGIDPSTTEEEIYLEMESLSGAHRSEFKVSTISNMRDGMRVAWVTCPLQTAVKIAENGVVTLEDGKEYRHRIGAQRCLENHGYPSGVRIIQVNLNRSWGALDLLRQYMIEADIGLAIVAESPSRIEESSTYFKSLDELAAILWRPEGLRHLSYKLSSTISRFATLPFLVCGDFNAHSTLWGSTSLNRRGELITRWSAMFDLRLLNTGVAYTCIRPQGGSIVDLSWVSSGLVDCVEGCAILPDSIDNNLNQYVDWIRSIMRSACNTAAPLVKSKNQRRQIYWWISEISDLRSSAIKARRLWHRCRHSTDTADILAKKNNYMLAKKVLRSAIKKAKSSSWAELISSIETDPWGLPYKLVMRKLRKSSPTLSETIGEDSLNQLLDSLFPGSSSGVDNPILPVTPPSEEDEETNVNIAQIKKIGQKTTV
ncbi:uncharacterized protein LOC112638009 [Camponotus floridanus]|uniref:uncharacterized protein LOC112638009 n=1 Tax=Camponotus floridanus TaxID=104421 RepID=UPI000DC6971E|nr:uncharacterized protein LOC112638009 [Camponotus floridanus]